MQIANCGAWSPLFCPHCPICILQFAFFILHSLPPSSWVPCHHRFQAFSDSTFTLIWATKVKQETEKGCFSGILEHERCVANSTCTHFGTTKSHRSERRPRRQARKPLKTRHLWHSCSSSDSLKGVVPCHGNDSWVPRQTKMSALLLKW